MCTVLQQYVQQTPFNMLHYRALQTNKFIVKIDHLKAGKWNITMNPPSSPTRTNSLYL